MALTGLEGGAFRPPPQGSPVGSGQRDRHRAVRNASRLDLEDRCDGGRLDKVPRDPGVAQDVAEDERLLIGDHARPDQREPDDRAHGDDDRGGREPLPRAPFQHDVDEDHGTDHQREKTEDPSGGRSEALDLGRLVRRTH
jgi:hypothetical protein